MTPAIHRWPPAVLIAAALWAAASAAGSALGRGGGALDLVVLAVGLTAGGFLAIPLANGSSVPVGRALLLPLAASSPMAAFLVVAGRRPDRASGARPGGRRPVRSPPMGGRRGRGGLRGSRLPLGCLAGAERGLAGPGGVRRGRGRGRLLRPCR